MILTGNEDLRVQRTIESIQKSFQDLIMEKDYEKITVKELCEKARINKKTFYVYYETLDDLLLELQMTLSQEYRERIQAYTLKDLPLLIREFFLFSEEKGAFYEKITCGGSYNTIREKMILKVNDQRDSYPELQKISSAEQKIIRKFLAESLLSIYKTWIESGKELPVEQIIDLATTLLVNGVKKYMK